MKSSLPEWLTQAKETLPEWLASLRHPSHAGRYRWAREAYEPYDLVSSYAAAQVYLTLAGMPPEEIRAAWVDWILSHQRPADGHLIDPRVERHIRRRDDVPYEEQVFSVRRTFTRNGLLVAESLGGRPRHRLAHQEVYDTPEALIAHIEGLDWSWPWGAGAHAGAVILNQHFNRLAEESSPEERARCEELVEAGVRWMARAQDPRTGVWGAVDAEPFTQINGVFKVWAQLLGRTSLEVQYPEPLIDLCLRGLRDDPHLNATPDTCSIYDVALVLDACLRCTDHRRDEAADACRAAMDRCAPMLRADGAFSYLPDWRIERGMIKLAPCLDQGDLGGTQLLTQGLALLANVAGVREELGWIPTTEWSMTMDAQEQ